MPSRRGGKGERRDGCREKRSGAPGQPVTTAESRVTEIGLENQVVPQKLERSFTLRYEGPRPDPAHSATPLPFVPERAEAPVAAPLERCRHVWNARSTLTKV